MADLVEEIKMRVNIEEIVSQYVQLKKAGKNFKGLCPFHNEKSPSFVVSPEKQICWCFGCQKGGDVFNFIQEVENIDFSETINFLAGKLSIDTSKFRTSVNKVSKSEKEESFRIHEVAAKFFTDQLMSTDTGKKVLDYVLKRGIKDEILKEFSLGWGPDEPQILYSHLLKEGFKKEVIMKSGLVTVKDTAGTKIYDRFRGRLIFPIYDSLGRIVAFAGRAMKKGQQPKYLNSAESKIYNKRALLYGYAHNKQEIKKENSVVVVEGYFDVMASVQMGVKNVVATCGTALTVEQVNLLKRLTKNVVFAFDSDKAGIDAARRGVDVAQPLEMMILVAIVDSGKDAADLLREDPEKWPKIIEGAVEYLDFFMDFYQKSFDDSDPAKVQKILNEVLPMLKGIKSRVLRDKGVRCVAAGLSVKPEFVYEDLERLNMPDFHHQAAQTDSVAAVTEVKHDDYDHLLGLMVEYPESVHDYEENLKTIEFKEGLHSIYKKFWNHYNPSRLEFDKELFLANLSSDEKRDIDILTLYIEQKYGEFSFDAIKLEVGSFIKRISHNKDDSTRRELIDRLRKAEDQGDMDLVQKILAEIQKTY